MTGRRVVLVVDDEAITREVVETMLVLAHVEVHSAHDGESALAKARDVRPDLVLLDVMMPGMDGVEVCRRLTAEPDPPRVVMLTARSDDATRKAAAAAGAQGYLVKPFSAVDLFRYVDEEPARGA